VVAEGRRHQAHQLRLCKIRLVGRAQTAARAGGQGSRQRAEMTRVRVLLLAVAFAPLASFPQGPLNLYCNSPNTAWVHGMAVGFERATGTKVAVIQKATGEMLAQIKAERASPRGDIWWAGAADSYLQAAEEGLLEEYKSPNVAELYPWARRISDISKNRVS